MSNHGYGVAMTARFGTHDAETIFGVVIGDALDQTGQNFPGRCFRLRLHLIHRKLRIRALLLTRSVLTTKLQAETRRPTALPASQRSTPCSSTRAASHGATPAGP